MELSILLNNIYPLSPDAFSLINENVELISVKKGTQIIRQGEKAPAIIFIKDGIFRVGHESNGKERTFAFGIEGDPFTSIASYRSGDSAVYSFEAIVDSTVWMMPIPRFKELVESNPEISRWFLSLLLEQLHAFERRGAIFGGLTAIRKYENFIYNRPEIIRHVPAKYIAQYLDIAPETLSRIQASFYKSSRK